MEFEGEFIGQLGSHYLFRHVSTNAVYAFEEWELTALNIAAERMEPGWWATLKVED